MAEWIMPKKVFKVTDSISKKISIPIDGVQLFVPTVSIAPTPTITEPVSSTDIDDLQDQIDDIVDSIENKYYTEYVFDKYDYFISTKPFYFYFEVPLGTVEIVSARVSFEVKDYRNSSLTDSRYAINGESEARPIITFYVSEDKGCRFGNAYGQYETDMRAIDISNDLRGEGIKIIKFTTDNDVCLSARIFLGLKIDKDKTPNSILGGGNNDGNDGNDGDVGGVGSEDSTAPPTQTIGGSSERPEVRTLEATSIIGVSATLNGDIISVGEGNYVDRTTGEVKPVTCTKRGFKYGLTKTDTWDTNESGVYVRGTFGISVSSLTPETDYYFRAYANNQVGRSYGEYMKLTTLEAIPVIYMLYRDDVSAITYINSYNSGGTLVDTWTIETSEQVGNALAVDVNGNVYTISGNQHDIRKRDSNGDIVLHKVENTNWIYNIVAGSDGYIYTQEDDGSINKLSKRNASDLVSIGTKTIGGNVYYGMTIDSDGDLYLMNDTDSNYERWDFTDGLVSSVTALHTTFNSLGVIGSRLADIDWGGGGHGLTRAKDLSGGETDVNLTDITRPGSVGNTKTHFLFTGYDEDSMLVLGKYTTSLAKVWAVIVPDSASYGYGSIAAYPF